MFRETKATVPIHLHPSRLNDVIEGCHEVLNQFVMK